MSPSLADAVSRRVLPRAVVVLSRADLAPRLDAAARRRLHRRGRIELYFAFDDPCSAVAIIDLADRIAGRAVQTLVYPVVQRGIPDDPAVEQKRAYAIEDAARLAQRSGDTLVRTAPLAAQDTAFLAEWVAAAPQGPALLRFCVRALRRLWLESDGPVRPDDYTSLWRGEVGPTHPAPAPSATGADAVARNEKRMARRGPYDTPAAWVGGQWFFAHDRLPQIGERLDELGWTTAT